MHRVLFVQSMPFFTADTEIHYQLMRNFDINAVEVHVACTRTRVGDPATGTVSWIQRLAKHVRTRFVNYGPQRPNGKRDWAMLPVGIVLYIATILRLAVYVRWNAIDIIHCSDRPRDSITAYLVARLSRKHLVVHVHVGYEDWINRISRFCIRHADGVIGVSDFVAGTLRDGGVHPNKVYAVRNALDLEHPRWNEDHGENTIRKEFGITETAPLVAIVARIFSWKGHERLLRAMPRVLQEYPDTRLLIVGSDANPGRRPYSNELAELAEVLGISHAVIFTGHRTDIPAIMQAMDVFVLPSWEEPFGMVYLEAMHHGKPCVGLARGGPKEIIDDGITGYLVGADEEDGLANAVLRLLESPGLARCMGEAGKAKVAREFGSRRMCQDVQRVYEAVAASRRS